MIKNSIGNETAWSKFYGFTYKASAKIFLCPSEPASEWHDWKMTLNEWCEEPDSSIGSNSRLVGGKTASATGPVSTKLAVIMQQGKTYSSTPVVYADSVPKKKATNGGQLYGIYVSSDYINAGNSNGFFNPGNPTAYWYPVSLRHGGDAFNAVILDGSAHRFTSGEARSEYHKYFRPYQKNDQTWEL